MNDERVEKEEFSLVLNVALPCPDSLKKNKNEEFVLEFFCEGPGDDNFSFQLETGLVDGELEYLRKQKPLKKEMTVSC